MFRLSFRFVYDDLELIKTMTEKQFDQYFGDISGQIELHCGGETVGFYHEEVPFGNELILLWFKRLNEVVFLLKTHNYIAMNVIENNNWIEFIKEDDSLRLNFVEGPDLSKINGFITNTPINSSEKREWGEVKISYDGFLKEINQKTNELLEMIKQINIKLLEADIVTRILNMKNHI
ncbi:hypothetical protein ACFO9Q_03005 [Paenibacillus sp. GCM10023252]|uniref:hypothetical protein n=1 Tax=Paenibacillus sp. GCM10023252 TaxID=3252649 RepID=UPI00361D634E